MIILDYRDRRPIYEQVLEKLKELMLLDVLKENDPLPSVRSLAMDLSINPNTIQRAYAELERQAKRLSREAIIREAMKRFGGAIICRDLAEAMALSNAIAPEHLELSVADPEALLEQVENAGSVFLGHSTPEPVGDYFAGPNHVLPTGGTSRFFSPLSVDGFYKKTQFLGYSEAALRQNGEQIMAFAQAEGLTAHANSVQVRLEEAQHAAK